MKTQIATVIIGLVMSATSLARVPVDFDWAELEQKKESVFIALRDVQPVCLISTGNYARPYELVEAAASGSIDRTARIINFDKPGRLSIPETGRYSRDPLGAQRYRTIDGVKRVQVTVDAQWKVITGLVIQDLKPVRVNHGSIDRPDMHDGFEVMHTLVCEP